MEELLEKTIQEDESCEWFYYCGKGRADDEFGLRAVEILEMTMGDKSSSGDTKQNRER